jgi:hypothetical protein
LDLDSIDELDRRKVHSDQNEFWNEISQLRVKLFVAEHRDMCMDSQSTLRGKRVSDQKKDPKTKLERRLKRDASESILKKSRPGEVASPFASETLGPVRDPIRVPGWKCQISLWGRVVSIPRTKSQV